MSNIEDNTIFGSDNANVNGNGGFGGLANIEDNFISGEDNASVNGNSVFGAAAPISRTTCSSAKAMPAATATACCSPMPTLSTTMSPATST